MHYDFNKSIDRSGTSSVKYGFRKEYFGKEDVIPLWVADMDFAAPPCVTEAFRKRAEHPVYGYSILSDGYYQAVIDWLQYKHGWEVERDWISHSPGIVTALNILVQAFTSPGDKVIVQPPVYFPFYKAVENNGRTLVYNQLTEKDNRYFIDFEDLEAKAREGASMMIISHPHNPVGRVWTRDELIRLGELSLKYGFLVVSDEIHSDLVFDAYKHIPLASLSDDLAANTVSCFAPSKTFNLAGMATSSVIISDEKLRKTYREAVERVHTSANIFGSVASEAAYKGGGEWLKQLMEYLSGNAEMVEASFDDRLPLVKVSPLEATYLMWLDFRGFGLKPEELKKKLIHEAGVGLADGAIFGSGGEGFQRLNIACPGATLKKALDNIARAFI